jgi:hypothetical protein
LGFISSDGISHGTSILTNVLAVEIEKRYEGNSIKQPSVVRIIITTKMEERGGWIVDKGKRGKEK